MTATIALTHDPRRAAELINDRLHHAGYIDLQWDHASGHQRTEVHSAVTTALAAEADRQDNDTGEEHTPSPTDQAVYAYMNLRKAGAAPNRNSASSRHDALEVLTQLREWYAAEQQRELQYLPQTASPLKEIFANYPGTSTEQSTEQSEPDLAEGARIDLRQVFLPRAVYGEPLEVPEEVITRLLATAINEEPDHLQALIDAAYRASGTEAAKPGELEILELLERGRAELSSQQIEQYVMKEHAIARSRVRHALMKLINQGLVTVWRGNRRTLLHSITPAGREHLRTRNVLETKPERGADTERLERLALAAVEIGILLGEDKHYGEPLILLDKIGHLLRAGTLPNPSNYTTGDNYTASARKVHFQALADAQGNR